ncbi:hypothetical protein ABMA27_003066 [Loxostege sticticalis]|uniref:Transposase n=1 Tax=Loxostege sticticalis TaxID=481309 RepID=A0ABR3HRX8_LOXSC
MWTDDTAHASTKVPEGKGERLIICHAGNTKGFIPNCLLAFKSKKANEYHEEMNIILTNLMDNAKYHSRQVNKAPTTQNNKATLVEWLNNNNVVADMTMVEEKILKLVKEHKPLAPTYYLDEIAKTRGHQVLRLPPYHCQYNAIELIWAQIKGYAALNNTTPPFTVNKIMTYFCLMFTSVTYTKTTILKDWERYIEIDRLKDQLIIHVGDDDSSSDSDNVDDSSETE